MRRSLLFLTLLFILILSFFLTHHFYLTQEQGDSFSDLEISPLWENAINKVYERWSQGIPLNDPHLLKNCPELKNLPLKFKEFSKCHPQLFSCFFEKRPLKLKSKHGWKSFSVKIRNHWKSIKDDIDISLSTGKRKAFLKLENKCHKVELPQGFYIHPYYKKSKKFKDNIWFTSGIRYKIDRYLVRNADLIPWKKRKGESFSLSSSLYFSPVTNLSPKEMSDYCHFTGGQILTAKIHDALTYHHGRENIKRLSIDLPSINTSPHPFGPRKDDGPQFKNKFEPKGCSQIYSWDCLIKKIPPQTPPQLGWSGVGELLGGPMEYVINETLPRRNIIPSSYYFSYNSPWHQAGQFAYWNGRGHKEIDFNFLNKGPPKLIRSSKSKRAAPPFLDVGFRCMYISEGMK